MIHTMLLIRFEFYLTISEKFYPQADFIKQNIFSVAMSFYRY